MNGKAKNPDNNKKVSKRDSNNPLKENHTVTKAHPEIKLNSNNKGIIDIYILKLVRSKRLKFIYSQIF
jgi:hypothetical protein